MGRRSISMVLSLAVSLLVTAGVLSNRLNYQSGGTMLLSVLAFWADPPKSDALSNVEGSGEDGEK